jgi:pimeloyl-ACP methyl ester carboxylesterase
MSTQTAPDRFLQRDGARLRWRLEGSGPALVLLHGWALDLAYWDPVVSLLAPHCTVLRFDRRGFGLSEGRPDIHRNAEDLRAVLDAAAVNRAVLVGMSQGARLALHFRQLHPLRTRALLLDGAPVFDAELELPLAEYRRMLDTGGPAALHAGILHHPLMRLRTTDAATRDLLAMMVMRYRATDLQQQVPRAAAPDLGAITVPTLIMNGSFDGPVRHEAARRLQAVIPGARRVELVGAGHLAALDEPAGYAREVLAFCGSLPP